MVIEWLRFQVNEELREQFIQKDDEIWTAALAQYPGFLSKEVWISPENLDEVITIIHWESFELWQSIPTDELQKLEQAFSEAMGSDSYELVESKHYQVRKRVHG